MHVYKCIQSILKVESDLPFCSISNEVLYVEVLSLPSQTLPFSIHASVYFSNNDIADRFDINANPELLTLCDDVECKYYDVASELHVVSEYKNRTEIS